MLLSNLIGLVLIICMAQLIKMKKTLALISIIMVGVVTLISIFCEKILLMLTISLILNIVILILFINNRNKKKNTKKFQILTLIIIIIQILNICFILANIGRIAHFYGYRDFKYDNENYYILILGEKKSINNSEKDLLTPAALIDRRDGPYYYEINIKNKKIDYRYGYGIQCLHSSVKELFFRDIYWEDMNRELEKRNKLTEEQANQIKKLLDVCIEQGYKYNNPIEGEYLHIEGTDIYIQGEAKDSIENIIK